MKFDLIKKALNPKVIGYVFAFGSAVMAFSSSMDERKKGEEFERLVKDVEELKKKQ